MTHSRVSPSANSSASEPFFGKNESVELVTRRVAATQILQELQSNIPVEVVLEFEDFLHDPKTDEMVEYEADRHRFSGSAQAYQDSMHKVATQNFPVRNVSIDMLLNIHSRLFTLTQSKTFRERIANIIMESRTQARADMEVTLGVSPEHSDLLNEIETTHISEIAEEELGLY
jgi:hypothetical protein